MRKLQKFDAKNGSVYNNGQSTRSMNKNHIVSNNTFIVVMCILLGLDFHKTADPRHLDEGGDAWKKLETNKTSSLARGITNWTTPITVQSTTYKFWLYGVSFNLI